MKEQMELQDVDGMTALMHATRSGNVAIFQGIAKCICSSQVSSMDLQQGPSNHTCKRLFRPY